MAKTVIIKQVDKTMPSKILILLMFFMGTAFASQPSAARPHPRPHWIEIPLPATPLGITSQGKKLWVVGEHEMIAQSVDGGLHWSVLHLAGPSMLFSVSFPTRQIGYIVGSDMMAVKTVDGGKRWLPLSLNNYGRKVTFIDADHGAIAFLHDCQKRRTIHWIFTQDGGQHWKSTWNHYLSFVQLSPRLFATITHPDYSKPKRFSEHFTLFHNFAYSSDGAHWNKLRVRGFEPFALTTWHGQFWSDGLRTKPSQFGAEVSNDGKNWTSAPAPPVPFFKCRPNDGCLDSGGWAQFTPSAIHYWKTSKMHGGFVTQWAHIGAHICIINTRLWCEKSTRLAHPAMYNLAAHHYIIKDPKEKSAPNPIFPRYSYLHGINFIAINITISRTGKVKNEELISTPWAVLAGPTLKSAAHWRFRPGIKNGKPIDVTARICLNYRY